MASCLLQVDKLRPNWDDYTTPGDGRFLFECVDACDIHPGNQEMNVMGAFVGKDSFEVHHMTHNRIFIGDPHTAQYLSGFPGDFQRHMHIVALGH